MVQIPPSLSGGGLLPIPPPNILKMEYEDCEGCREERKACYMWGKTPGYNSGLDWYCNHCFHFVVDSKTGELVVY